MGKLIRVAALCLAAMAVPARALTPANTTIDNTASASFVDPAGTPVTATSNTVSLVVDELLDVAIADGGDVAVRSPESDRALAFTVTNTGNGAEAFAFHAEGVSGDDFNPEDPAHAPRIHLETDGVAGFSAGDALYVPGANEPLLAPDAQQVVYFVSNIPAAQVDGSDGTLRLRATAATCTAPAGDAAGTLFAGGGDGGTDAVVGLTGCSQADQAAYVVSAVSATLVKSQSVADPFGGTSPVPGAVITYTLTFAVSGSGSITLGQIADAIPANTTYVPGSITLNGVAQTDAADAPGVDDARFTGAGIEVNLPSPLAAPTTQTVTFRVAID